MSYSIVGAFVIALGAVLVAGVLWLASGGAWQKKYELYRAIEDESVAGLNLNAPVKYNGVDVGKVRAIELDHDQPVARNTTLDQPLRDGTRATAELNHILPRLPSDLGRDGTVAILKMPAIQSAHQPMVCQAIRIDEGLLGHERVSSGAARIRRSSPLKRHNRRKYSIESRTTLTVDCLS